MDSLHHEQNNFKPFIPAEKRVSEFTATSVILGIILAVLFGGANAYLGLRVGMTVSASIPAAVISMGVIRIILRKDSVLENNMVRRSVQPESPLRQELSLPCRYFLCGQRKEKVPCPG